MEDFFSEPLHLRAGASGIGQRFLRTAKRLKAIRVRAKLSDLPKGCTFHPAVLRHGRVQGDERLRKEDAEVNGSAVICTRRQEALRVRRTLYSVTKRRYGPSTVSVSTSARETWGCR